MRVVELLDHHRALPLNIRGALSPFQSLTSRRRRRCRLCFITVLFTYPSTANDVAERVFVPRTLRDALYFVRD